MFLVVFMKKIKNNLKFSGILLLLLLFTANIVSADFMEGKFQISKGTTM